MQFFCEWSSDIWLHGQVVKTPPFHGGNRGSNPLGVTKPIEKWAGDLNPRKFACGKLRCEISYYCIIIEYGDLAKW